MRARKISTGWGTRLPARSTRSSRPCVIPFEVEAVWLMRVVTSRARRAAAGTIWRGCPRTAHEHHGPGRQRRAADHRRLAGAPEALGEGSEDGAERLRLGALGPARPSARVPGEDVQVGP